MSTEIKHESNPEASRPTKGGKKPRKTIKPQVELEPTQPNPDFTDPLDGGAEDESQPGKPKLKRTYSKWDKAPSINKRFAGYPDKPKKPRQASEGIKLWSFCVKEVAKAMKVKPPIVKGSEVHTAVKKLFDQKMAMMKKKVEGAATECCNV